MKLKLNRLTSKILVAMLTNAGPLMLAKAFFITSNVFVRSFSSPLLLTVVLLVVVDSLVNVGVDDSISCGCC